MADQIADMVRAIQGDPWQARAERAEARVAETGKGAEDDPGAVGLWA